MGIDILDKLDLVLSLINSNLKGTSKDDFMESMEIYKYCNRSNIKITKKEFVEILHKLEEDKVVIKEDNKGNTDNIYFSTVKGQILMKRGGYKEKYRKENITTNLQSAQTWAIAIGTVLAAVGSLGLLFSDKLRWIGTIQFLTLVFVSIFVGIGTIILIMVWQSLFRKQ